MPHPPNTLSLVADIGGTNTRVALADGPRVLPETIRRYSNADHPGLETVLNRYMDEEGGVDCRAACVDVAGPVRNGRGTLTNLDWTIDTATLARAARAETVAILNDLQAQGPALGHIAPEHLIRVVAGPEPAEHETKLVVNVGTGFNATPVFETRKGRFVAPSECGHVNLPIRSQDELELGEYVSTVHGFPGVEEVLSGRGIERVYAWLGHRAGDPREKSAKDIMAALDDGSDPRAEEAARVFTRILGSVSGNLALIHLPFGGVYLVGGVVRALTPHLSRFGFTEAFRDKGRFAGFMGNFAVDMVTDDYAALTGCAAHLVDLLD